MFKRMKEDIKSAKAGDPASRSSVEVLFCYPGIWAIWFHLINHWLWNKGAKFLARFFSTIARFLTGIEIHPGAQIGRRIFIDHGMGIVIGETAIVGDDVLLYQGAVLGGTSLEKKKRHPTIENDVVVGAGAKVLGNVTIGAHSKIGAGSVVLKNVPPNSTCVGVPGRIVRSEDTISPLNLEHSKLPDPVKESLKHLLQRQDKIEEEIQTLKKFHGIDDPDFKYNDCKEFENDMIFKD
ncbi:serine O-acetyltransferase [uncultured Methanobrevibacter sp.]|uniref:serine O-acetyltransferase n=1 Tax=uncultured Methanobrevibacter sp. TaxID=253161 RepID=UPI0025D955B7|nr:serine O-acetyltransferase [uncultured Methanobrevibacter sp.]